MRRILKALCNNGFHHGVRFCLTKQFFYVSVKMVEWLIILYGCERNNSCQ